MKKLFIILSLLFLASLSYAQTYYVPRVGKIYVHRIQVANTWETAIPEALCQNTKGFKIKSRYTYGEAPKPFDYSFASPPTASTTITGNGYWSNTGSGSSDYISPSNGIYVRAREAGTIIEISIYE